jgi:hypothetical protein
MSPQDKIDTRNLGLKHSVPIFKLASATDRGGPTQGVHDESSCLQRSIVRPGFLLKANLGFGQEPVFLIRAKAGRRVRSSPASVSFDAFVLSFPDMG